MAVVSRRKKKQASCSKLRRKAKRIKNRNKRKRALRRLPNRCKPHRPAEPTPPQNPVPSGGTQPAATMIAPPASGTPVVTAPPPAPPAPPVGSLASPIAVYSGSFGPREAERLLWRAGFGPKPGQAAQLAAMGLDAAVLSLTRPPASRRWTAPTPTSAARRSIPTRPGGTTTCGGWIAWSAPAISSSSA